MSMESEFSGDMFPREHVTILQTPPQNREGYVTLYKGQSLGIAYQGQMTLTMEERQLNMSFMGTCSGGDFNGQDTACVDRHTHGESEASILYPMIVVLICLKN
ncbi:hypothetical protein OCU04_001563 [Sclerotinia nivalis]|uniref:Uncharacterized protein n=1 Tax=Sclerotinia nivalis TaxID=352851 RepID=A0A9X0AZF9_9HELO|nr:hypothetical protein OCU04_001563 [Sclerotinia nivalis]